MARKAKAKTRAEQMAENIDLLVRERDEARAAALDACREVARMQATADNLREAVAEHAEDAERWRERAERLREARDRLRFALDVVRERDELRAAKGGATC